MNPGPLRSAGPIFVKMNSMKVADIYKYQVAKFVFKCLNKITSVQFHNWFKLNHLIHGHNTRSNYNVSDGVVINHLFVPSVCTSNYGLKQIKVKGPRIWNDLPVHLKNTRSVYVFLKNLKAYYISNYE